MLNAELTLVNFWKKVIKDSRSNLTRHKKNASKELYNSLEYNVESSKEGVMSTFGMEEYGIYQDKGVSGTERKFNTPFEYTNKKPPASAFSSWSIRRGIAPRTSGGQFAARRSLQFALANWVYKMGIEPSLFLTNPFEREFNRLPEAIQLAVGKDVEDLLRKL